MKRRIVYRTGFLISMSLFFASCEKTFNTILDIDIPHTPLIVFECLVGKASNVTSYESVSVSSSVSVTGAKQPFELPNAKPYIFENGVLKDSFQYSSFYQTNFESYKSGAIYTVKIAYPNYTSVETSDIMPQTTAIKNVAFTKEAKQMYIDGNTQPTRMDEIKITFNNNVSEKDFYMFRLGTNSASGQYFCVYSSDIDIENENTTDDPFSTNDNCINNTFFMQDLNFNGKEKTLVLYAPSEFTDQITRFWDITISHLTENYYKFVKTRQLYNENDGNPFAEPVQIHSNVINGVGIFALKKDTILKL